MLEMVQSKSSVYVQYVDVLHRISITQFTNIYLSMSCFCKYLFKLIPVLSTAYVCCVCIMYNV